MKAHYYYSNTYRQRFYFLIGVKPDHVVSFIKKTFNYDYEQDLGHSAGSCILIDTPKKKAIIIWTLYKTRKMLPDLAHECLHAVNYVLSERGVAPSFENDEPQTYLLAELIEQALGLTKQPKP